MPLNLWFITMADPVASYVVGVGCALEYYSTYTSWFASLSECCCSEDVEIGLYAQKTLFVGSVTSVICELQGYLEGMGGNGGEKASKKRKGKTPQWLVPFSGRAAQCSKCQRGFATHLLQCDALPWGPAQTPRLLFLFMILLMIDMCLIRYECCRLTGC